MKKRLIAFIIAATAAFTCCLTSCDTDDTPSSSVSSYVPTRLNAPYDAENLSAVLFTDVQKAFTVDVTANTRVQTLLSTAEYYTPNSTANDTTSTDAIKYRLTLQDVEMQIGYDGAIVFRLENGTTQQAVVFDNGFAYLDTLVDGDPFTLDKYTSSYNIKIYDAENNGGAVKDKTAFIDALKALRFVKLNDKDFYQTGAATYTLRLGNDEMFVYPKYVVLNDELYFVCQGNFAFLDDVEIGEVTLPWL